MAVHVDLEATTDPVAHIQQHQAHESHTDHTLDEWQNTTLEAFELKEPKHEQHVADAQQSERHDSYERSHSAAHECLLESAWLHHSGGTQRAAIVPVSLLSVEQMTNNDVI